MTVAPPLIQWTSELSVGIPSIDEQHQKLVNMINALNEAMRSGEAQSVLAKVFAGLVTYTDRHFSHEEQLFARHGYTGSTAHRSEHDALRKQVVELQKKLNSGGASVGVETMDFLKEWLKNHICKSDKAYAPFLKSKGVN